MSTEYVINAEVRKDMGKGASRRLRHANKIPAIIYGGTKDPVALTLDHNATSHALDNEAFYSSVLTVKIDKDSEQAVLKAVQRLPGKKRILHLDLQRISATEKLHMNVPLHFIGSDVAPGVKEGGIVSHTQVDVEVACFPKDLPEFIEVDLTNVELNGSVHLSDLKIPEGIELVELAHGPEHDLPVASIHLPRVAKEEEEVEAEAAEGEEAAPAAGEGEAEAKGDESKD